MIGAPQELIDEVWGDCYRALPHFDGGLVVDIGAGVGVFSAFARGPVRAVEGHPLSATLLRANVPEAEVLEWVAGDGTPVNVREAGHGIQSWPFGPTPTHTLDEILRGDEVSVLKVDIEGAEYPLLHGADLSQAAYLAVEIHVWSDGPNDEGLGIRPGPMPSPTELVDWISLTHSVELSSPEVLTRGGLLFGVR